MRQIHEFVIERKWNNFPTRTVSQSMPPRANFGEGVGERERDWEDTLRQQHLVCGWWINRCAQQGVSFPIFTYLFTSETVCEICRGIFFSRHTSTTNLIGWCLRCLELIDVYCSLEHVRYNVANEMIELFKPSNFITPGNGSIKRIWLFVQKIHWKSHLVLKSRYLVHWTFN